MKKRIISLGLSLAMVLTSANSIFAEEVKIDGSPATLPYTTSAASGSGALEYLDKDITVVTLPTGSLDFSMDPQGIVGAKKAVEDAIAADKASNGSLTLSDADLQSTFEAALPKYKGRIYGNSVFTVRNEGANEVGVGVSLIVEAARDGVAANSKTKFVPASASAKLTTTQVADATVTPTPGTASDKDNNISINLAFTDYNEDTDANAAETGKGKISYAAKADNTQQEEKILAVDPFESTPSTVKGYVSLDKNGCTIPFKLDEDITYGFKYSYDAGTDKSSVKVAPGIENLTSTSAKLNTKATSFGFTLSGKLNTNADWTDYASGGPEEVKVTAIYNVTKIGTETVVKTADRTGSPAPASPFGTAIVDGDITAIAAASLAITSANTNDPSQEIEFTFTPSVMASTATLDSSVAPLIDGNPVTINTFKPTSDYYVFSGNKLTIKPAFFTAGSANATSKVTVKGTDGNTYEAQLH